MRSSKSRSRSKSNRSNNNNRSTVGNIVNRVFDSSGPEGKVRGTPQQIIDKYNQLARDAQLGNDRVAAENFQQHAEHYLRMLSSAQKEMDARREEQERQNRERQAERDRERGPRNDRDGNDNAQSDSTPDQPRHEQQRNEQPRHEQPRQEQPRQEQPRHEQPRPQSGPGDDVVELRSDDSDSGLVETPESKSEVVVEKPKRVRKPRTPAAKKEPAAPKPKTKGADKGEEPNDAAATPQASDNAAE